MKFSARGFTLMELLVVVAIISIIGVYALSNYKSFGEDQNLKNSVLDIQSKLRTAQANATSNTKCDTQYNATWEVGFENDNAVNLNCRELPDNIYTKKTINLGNIILTSVRGEPDASCPPETAFSVIFNPLSGNINFKDDNPGGGILDGCSKITLTLENTKTIPPIQKKLIIEKGGRIYAE